MSETIQRQIIEDIEASEGRLLGIARMLVAEASPNPPGDVAAVARVAGDLLRNIPGCEVQEFETAPGIVNLVARIRADRPGRRLIFNGHLDTFPIGEDLGWTRAPLGGEVADGKIYGRGISDMKGGIAAALVAADALARHPTAWDGELVITLAGDEETMGSLGTRWLLENVPHARGDAMISGDVGSTDVVRFGEKGLLWLELSTTGQPAHGAHVHRGINAIDRLRRALDAVKELEQIEIQTPPAVVKAIAQAKAVSERVSGAGESDTLQRITVNIGVIEGGVSPNLIPARASAKIDIRLPVGITANEVREKLDRALKLEGLSWKVIQHYDPFFTPPDHEIVQLVQAAATGVLGKPPVPNMRVGASDARLYRMFGIPSVVYGPTPFGMGGADEHVDVAELVAVTKVHALAALQFLSPS